MMLQRDAAAGGVAGIPVAYLVYGPDGTLLSHNDLILDFFPFFRGEDLIGLARTEVRRRIRHHLGARGHEVDKLDALSKAKGRLSSDLGVFELSNGSFYALDDLALPDGGTLTLVRDLTEKKHDLDIFARLEGALSRLAKEEAIYNGQKADAYRIMTEIAAKALGAGRTDVWLLNVDRTALYPQESYLASDASYQDLERLDRADCPDLFRLLEAGKPVMSTNEADDPAIHVLAIEGRQTDGLKSFLVAPICRGPRAIGAIVIGFPGTDRRWSQSEVSFAAYLADLVVRMLEAHDRQVAEEGLRGFNEMLEMRVKNRTRELEQALENLKLAQDELVRSEKMASLGGLVAGVAHEINTPLGVALTTITHMSEAVSQFESLVTEGKIRRSDLTDFMESTTEGTMVIRRNLERAAHLVRSFKMVAVDQAMDDARDLDITEYLGEIVDSLKPTLRKRGVNVVCAENGRLMMRTVAGDLSHVLTNLIMNAALHAFPDDPAHTDKLVSLKAVAGDGFVILEVTDNGRGIPKEIRTKIFEPFFTTARDKGGSGLGLNIVYNTVYQKMKGSIEVDDAPGGGTRFVIRLPMQPA